MENLYHYKNEKQFWYTTQLYISCLSAATYQIERWQIADFSSYPANKAHWRKKGFPLALFNFKTGDNNNIKCK